MGIIKSAFEKAMERADEIAPLTEEEKEKIKIEASVKEILSSYFKGDLTEEGLWKEFKERVPSEHIGTAQDSLVSSLSLRSSSDDFDRRIKGILALESLKSRPKTPELESLLSRLKGLSKEFEKLSEQAAEELRAAMEQNPQLRLKPVMTPDGRTVMQPALSVDEAVEARLSEFLKQQEEQYGKAFEMTLSGIRELIASNQG